MKITYRGNNTITDATRVVRIGGHASDDLITTSDRFNSLKYIDYALEAAMSPKDNTPPIRPIGGPNGRNGIKFKMYLDPFCATDLTTAKSTTDITWSEYAIAQIQGGNVENKKLATGMYLGKYKSVGLYVADYVTRGVSAAGAAVDTAARNVLVGAQAGIIAWGKGYGWNNFKTVPKYEDYDREYNLATKLIVGMKKCQFTDKDGNRYDNGAIIVPAYRAAHH